MYRITKHKHITIMHERLFVVADMLVKYYDTPEYDSTVFVLNYGFTAEFVKNMKRTYSRVIYYNLEHLSVESYDAQSNNWRPFLMSALPAYDEIWDFLIENYKYYPREIKSKYRFMPLRYIDLADGKPEKTIDLFFVGVLDTPIRKEMAARMSCMSLYQDRDKQTSTVIVSGLYASDCKKLMRQSKFNLDYPHYRLFGNTQNTVRIHESICSNIQVISYTDTDRVIDYYPNLINIINPVDGFDKNRTLEIIDSYDESKNESIAKAYSDMTSSDEAYQAYRQRFLRYM